MQSGDGTVQRPRWRARLVRVFFVVVLVGQAVLLVRAYWDPHVLFGFQPFNESSTWRADIVRVTVDGRRIPIDEDWPGGYDWDELMGWGPLQNPDRMRHAFSSLDTMLDFFGEAIDWAAEHTPDDHETLYLEAEVTAFRNTRGPEHHHFRSDDRDEASG